VNFQEAESYLYSLGNEVSAMKLGLDAMRVLLDAVGNPQKNYLKVQVAGTNGKGSVCAFLDSICNTAGIKVGTFTSPHLISITERVRINDCDISDEEFARHATVVREVCERLVNDGTLETVPTFFEQVTAIALVAFADAGVEVAILETGLGGRLDATTAANAEIAAITRIDLDHQEYLGNTLEEIAAEKAAIIGPTTQAVVVGEQVGAALDVVIARCREFNIIHEAANKSYGCVIDVRSGKKIVYESDVDPPRDLGVELGLKGRHQIENAYTAVMISGVLAREFDVAISEEQDREGVKNAGHPGRLEYQGRYLFDGAHNVGGARALSAYLREFEQRPITLVFGAMEDKDVGEIANILFPLAEKVILTRPDNSRAMSVERLAAFADDDALITADVAEAVAVAKRITPEDGLILVTGSLYLVGEVKKLIGERESQI